MVPKSVTNLDLIQARVSEIPIGWELRKVKEALNIRNNLRKPISQEVRDTIKGQYPYYGPTKVQGYISEYEQDGTYALIGEDGDHFLKYGIMAQTQFISGKCTVNNHAHILESSDTCDSEWFFNYFKHRDITNFLSRQGAGRFKLNKATLEKLPILVPPLQEQRKIARILTTWGNAISTTEKLIANSKQQKKALTQHLLTGKKRLVNPETGEEFEGEWLKTTIGSIAKTTAGATPSTKKPEYWGGDIPWMSSGEINLKQVHSVEKRITALGFSKSSTKIIPKKSILIALAGQGKTRGTVAVNHIELCTNQSIAAILLDKEIADNNFVYFNLDSRYTELRAMSTGDGGRGGLNLSIINSVPFSIPEIKEQECIAKVLVTADKEIELLEEKLAHLKQEKKALMQQLLTGKRRVKIAA